MPVCPKPSRIKRELWSKETHDRDGVCLASLFLKEPCSEGLDAHHIKTRGSGGDDLPENLILLCRKHHQDAHANRITKRMMHDWLTFFYGYKYEEEE